MKAMILAAGFGTRLSPLTLTLPKAMMPVGNRPVIDRVIEYLKWNGVDEIIVNAHHFSNRIVSYLAGGERFGLQIEVRVEPEILGTGGGLKNVEDFWGEEPFIVMNSDILVDLDLSEALRAHRERQPLATLVLHDCMPFNMIKTDGNGRITEIGHEIGSGRLAFTGIHVVSPELLGHIPAGVKYDIIGCYRSLIRSGRPVGGYVSSGHYWRDMGTIESYVLSNKEALKGSSFLVGGSSCVHESVSLEGWAVIGERCVIEEGAKIGSSILWDNVRVRKGVKITESIVTSSKDVSKDLTGEIK